MEAKNARQEADLRQQLRLNGSVEFRQLEAGPDGSAQLPQISIVAYNGGAMRPAGAWGNTIVDLTGVAVPTRGGAVPILLNHDHEKIIGHAIVTIDGAITAHGVVSGTGVSAQEFLGSARNGFPWKSSIGLSVAKRSFLKESETATINGTAVSGPITIVERSLLGEISVLPWPADQTSSVDVLGAATDHTECRRHRSMDPKFAQWLEASGFDVQQLTDAQAVTLKASYDATQPPKPIPKVEAEPDLLTARREQEAAETLRVAEIRKVCAGDHPELEAQAIRQGWGPEKVELQVLRAERERAPAVHTPNREVPNLQVLEAAAARTGGLQNLERAYDEKVLDASDRLFRHGIGLQQLLMEAASMSGCHQRYFRGNEEEILRAAFSTKSLSGILSNTANKFLLEGFMHVEDAWRQIAERRSVTDFKTITSYRMTGDLQFEEVGPAGEIKHGTIDEESYTNQAKTYGKMFAITRTDLVNDDLGALTAVPRRIGRGAGLALNHVFWTSFMDNSAFFTSGRGNYISGATTTMAAAGLTQGVTAFRKLTDADGKPLGTQPRILLVPPDLEVATQELFVSTNINTSYAVTENIQRQPSANVFVGKYRPVISTYLSNTSYTGYSVTAWYLLADPLDMATIQVAFLNGRETPVVESADADFNTLGIQMRGYFDFGVAKTEYRAGVMSKGAA
jgi:hypothetical protein